MVRPVGNPNIADEGFGGSKRTKEQDDAYRALAKNVPRKRKWTREYCEEQLETCLDLLKIRLQIKPKIETDEKKLKNEEVRDAITLMNKILDYVRYLYPPVQQSVNVNVELQLVKAIDLWKEKNKDIIIINEGEEEEDEH